MNFRLIPILLCLLTLASGCMRAARPSQTRPRRLLVMVLDQFRPDYVQRLRLPHLGDLSRRSAVFENAIVGHLPATTVVSHEVLPRGRFPVHLAWSDDLFHDVEGKAGEPGKIHDPGEFSLERMEKLLTPHDATHLARAVPGNGRFLAVGQKRYAVFAMAGSLADVALAFSETLRAGDAGSAWEGWARPDGRGVPPAFLQPPGGRFWVDTRPSLGTENNVYRLGGYKYAPFLSNERVGGDAWVADAAMHLMESGDWRVALLTFGAVDRVGHMFGAERDLARPNPHLPFADVVRFADAQVGRMLEFLRRRGFESDTLVVVTADHAGMGAANWQGVDRPGGALDNWMWGDVTNVEASPQPRPVLAPLVKLGLRAAYTDTMLRFYFHLGSDLEAAGAVAATLPGVVWVGKKQASAGGFHYVCVHDGTRTLPDSERVWLAAHLPVLLRTYAGPASPDLIAALDARTSYGQPGEHGGMQESVQRIPLMISGPGVTSGVRTIEARLVDIAPTVWEIFTGRVPSGMDGFSLAPALGKLQGKGRE